MQPEGNKAHIFELADALLKSWWTVVAGICFGLAGAIVALNFLPEVYLASTQVRVAPQVLPERWVESTVNDDMSQRLMEVKQAILTRANMLELVEMNFGTPPDKESQDGLIRWLQARVKVFNPRNTRLFILTYEDENAERAAAVVNSLTDLYIEQNREFRSSQASSTRREFEQKAADAKAELDVVEQELNEFLSRHVHETETALGVNVQKLETRRRDLEKNRTDQLFNRQRLEDLRRQRAQGSRGVEAIGTVLGVAVSSAAQRVVQLQREMDELLVTHTESHPDVEAKRHALEEARARLDRDPADPERPAPPADPALAALDLQIEESQRQLNVLGAQERNMQAEIASIERKIERTPAVQSKLSDLRERHGRLQVKYADLKDKAERARESESLEETRRGQRLEIVERAAVPYKPESPDPQRVLLLGLIVGLVLFVGPLLLGRFLNPVVSSEAGLRSVIDTQVLVSIPRVITRSNVGIGRRRFFKNLAMSVLSTAALAAVFVVFGIG